MPKKPPIPPREVRRPFQSKLEPYTDEIRRWRIAHWTHRRIAAELLAQHHLHVAASTIQSFLKFRSRKRHAATTPSTLTPQPQSVDGFFEAPQNKGTHESNPNRKSYNLDL